MVRGEVSPLGFICSPLHFLVKCVQAVGAAAPLLMVPQKNVAAWLGGPCLTVVLESDSHLRRTQGGAA